MTTYWRTRLLLALFVVADVIFLGMVFVEAALLGLLAPAPGAEAGPELPVWPVTMYVWIKLYTLILLYAATGCGVIANDIRWELMQFYFSKPLKRLQYMLGKGLGLIALGACVTLVPTGILGGLRVLLHMKSDFAEQMMSQWGAAVVFELAALVVFSILLMALSSLTRKQGLAVLAWLGVIFVPDLTSLIIGQIVDSEWPHLLSLTASLTDIFAVIVQWESDLSPWLPPLVLLGIGAGAFYLAWWRLGEFEQM